ncbi:hypothetical protein [Methylacidiphilum sp. Yel]|uniref:hypothetical protein n=1 Tax=Methylacidiphilum sp. Yel TaxID=1847730 RepID=UPI001ABC3692|nr:hypothetical protein [Methylacidiphilum sp. Yel]
MRENCPCHKETAGQRVVSGKWECYGQMAMCPNSRERQLMLFVMCSTSYAGGNLILNQVGTTAFGQFNGENFWINQVGPVGLGHVGKENIFFYEPTFGTTMTVGRIGEENIWLNNGNEWMIGGYDEDMDSSYSEEIDDDDDN